MVEDYLHLAEMTAPVLDWDDDKRIHWMLRQRWIGYPLAKKIIARMEYLLNHPPSRRMPNLLIYGETNNGKTTIVQRFHEQHQPCESSDGESLFFPVMVVQMPPGPDEGRFYDALLQMLMAPYRQRDSISRKQNQAITILRNLGVRMLIIDEIHHLLTGRPDRQRLFLNSIKYLSNELQIPIVTAGIPDALRAIQIDPQLSNRFHPVELPRWGLNDNFRRLLASFERVLPLRNASALQNKHLAVKLHSMSEGILGELSSVLNIAAEHAIRTGKEKITLETLEAIDWLQPSNRRGR